MYLPGQTKPTCDVEHVLIVGGGQGRPDYDPPKPAPRNDKHKAKSILGFAAILGGAGFLLGMLVMWLLMNARS
ncbi:MAG: hypothetical protein FWD61_09475 [Phycisphaerales bacterium]|nr:hypothetical protein [Phycisphaerales bacterium]